MQRLVKCWIKRKVKLAYCFIYYRPYLQAPVIFAVFWFLVPALHAQAHAHRPVPALRYSYSWPYMAAYIVGAFCRSYSIKEIKPYFKVVVEPMRYFYRLM